MTLLVHITHAGLIGTLGLHFKHWLYGKCLAEHTHTHTQRRNFSHLNVRSSQLTAYTHFEVRSTRPLMGNIIQAAFAGNSLPKSFTLETRSEELTALQTTLHTYIHTVMKLTERPWNSTINQDLCSSRDLMKSQLWVEGTCNLIEVLCWCKAQFSICDGLERNPACSNASDFSLVLRRLVIGWNM